MLKRILFIVFLLMFISAGGFAQSGCTIGQSPQSAFPVCGTDTFFQSTVPACGGRSVLAPGCTGLADINPYWYRFTCFKSGSLGFQITPNDLNDDYDWQLFDITGFNASDVYTNASLFVACNWSGKPGITGASSAGNSLVVCGNTGAEPLFNPFSSMPMLNEGHEYILLISHFTVSSQSGYSLSFGASLGGTANITDPTEPDLLRARAICDGEKMTVKLSKKMKCSSLNPDGSDFKIIPPIAPIISAIGVNCGNEFDMDSIILTLGNPVPPGNYNITVQDDVNGTNLLDNCSRTIPLGKNLPVTVYPLIPTPMDSLSKFGCAPDVLELVFKTPMLCSSIAADGSDFTVTKGGNILPVKTAAGICSADGLTTVVQVSLSSPIQTAGNYRITLKTGSDGNTIINECGLETIAGSFIPFVAKDTVSAIFNYTIHLGCKNDSVSYSHDGRNSVNYWKWTFGNINSLAKDTTIVYPVSVSQNASLIVSNGTCSDTVNAVVPLGNGFNAAFEASNFVCPGDPAIFKDKSTGNYIRQWNWDLGEGKTSTMQNPEPQFYSSSNSIRDLSVRLIVTDSLGCTDTAANIIKVVGNCYIAVPKAFTPNNDGLNDFLYPTNAYKAKDLYFSVYNRLGQKIFETRDWTNKWDGTFKGNPQDPGTYVWILNYTNIDSGQRFELKGTTVLLR